MQARIESRRHQTAIVRITRPPKKSLDRQLILPTRRGQGHAPCRDHRRLWDRYRATSSELMMLIPVDCTCGSEAKPSSSSARNPNDRCRSWTLADQGVRSTGQVRLGGDCTRCVRCADTRDEHGHHTQWQRHVRRARSSARQARRGTVWMRPPRLVPGQFDQTGNHRRSPAGPEFCEQASRQRHRLTGPRQSLRQKFILVCRRRGAQCARDPKGHRPLRELSRLDGLTHEINDSEVQRVGLMVS